MNEIIISTHQKPEEHFYLQAVKNASGTIRNPPTSTFTHLDHLKTKYVRQNTKRVNAYTPLLKIGKLLFGYKQFSHQVKKILQENEIEFFLCAVSQVFVNVCIFLEFQRKKNRATKKKFQCPKTND